MTKKHFHAIPANLRPSNHRPVFINNKQGNPVEEGCYHRIKTVFSDPDLTREQLLEKLQDLNDEFLDMLQHAAEVIDDRDAELVETSSNFKTLIDEWLKTGVFADLLDHNLKPSLKTLTHGTVMKAVPLKDGVRCQVTLKRDHGGGLVHYIGHVKLGLKEGQHVLVKGDGSRPIEAIEFVWDVKSIKDFKVRASELTALCC